MQPSLTTESPIPFVSSGSYPARPGNFVRALVDGEPAFRRICEAIEAAKHSVWVTVTFMWPSFEMPDGRGSALDVLDRAAARGVDVRLIFWRPDTGSEAYWRNAFGGSRDHLALLDARRSGVKIRWDRAHPGFCQHQKSWLVDAGTETEIAFVGGINLNPHSMVALGHRGEGQNHDVYLELSGPSAVDVHHNFAQRWNESSERFAPNGQWGLSSETQLTFPVNVPARQGDAMVQIQRTIHAGRYLNGRVAPMGSAFDIGSGERSNFDQYVAAIEAARRSIYIENQYVEVLEIVTALHRALQRGVAVLLLMPSEPDTGAASEERQSFLEARAALGAFKNFTLAGMAGVGEDGRRKPVYVHAKLMLIDDEWATVGSCNLHSYSLFGNGEMNAAFWSPEAVRALRVELFAEHLAQDTSHLKDQAALQLFRETAQQNRSRFDSGNHEWQGLAFAVDIGRYGR